MTPDLMLGLWFSAFVLFGGLAFSSALVWIAQN